MKRRYVAMISAVLCSAMILSACGNSKKTESIYTGDKTEVPAWQANLDAISPSAYADVEGLRAGNLYFRDRKSRRDTLLG